MSAREVTMGRYRSQARADCLAILNRFLEFEYAGGRLRYANNSKYVNAMKTTHSVSLRLKMVWDEVSNTDLDVVPLQLPKRLAHQEGDVSVTANSLRTQAYSGRV